MKKPSTISSAFDIVKEHILNVYDAFIDALGKFEISRFFRRLRVSILMYLRKDQLGKLCCLLVATTAYYYIRSGGLDTTCFKVSVTPVITSDSSDSPDKPDKPNKPRVSILRTDPEEVVVTIRGFKDAISAINTRESRQITPSVQYEDKAKDSNTATIKLRPKMFTQFVSGDIDSIKLDPDTVTVTFDEDVTIDVPVKKPATVGKPVFEPYELVIDCPDTISVSGPKSVLGTYPKEYFERHPFKTTSIDLANRTDNFETTVQIIPGSNMDKLKFEESLKVNVLLKDNRKTRTIEGVKLHLASVSGDENRYVSNPTTLDLVVRGREEEIAKVAPENIFAVVACKADAISPEGTPCKVHVRLLGNGVFSGVDLVEEPKDVLISIAQPPAPEPLPQEPQPQEPQESPASSSESPESPPPSPEPPSSPESPSSESPAPPPAPPTADEPPPPEAPQ